MDESPMNIKSSGILQSDGTSFNLMAMNCLLVIFAFVISAMDAQSLKADIIDYFNSDAVAIMKREWLPHRPAMQHAIASALQEVIGRNGLNIFIVNPTDLKLANGYYHQHGRVQIIFINLELVELPQCSFPEVSFPLASNLIKIETKLSKIIVTADYYLMRNKSDLVNVHNPYKHSPFLFDTVPSMGRAALSLEGCMISGYVITRLSGQSINLGHHKFTLTRCNYNIEIYHFGWGGPPPVITQYSDKTAGDDLGIAQLVMKPLRGELISKIQGALFSYINTSAIFGSYLPGLEYIVVKTFGDNILERAYGRKYHPDVLKKRFDIVLLFWIVYLITLMFSRIPEFKAILRVETFLLIREEQRLIFHKSTSNLTSIMRDVNEHTATKNDGAADIDDFFVSWDDITPCIMNDLIIDAEGHGTLRLSNMVLTGLDTAYLSNSGGPYKLDIAMIGEQIRFSTIQIRGEVSYSSEDNDDQFSFAVEIRDFAVNIDIDIEQKQTTKMEMVGYREMEFSEPGVVFKPSEAIITGHLLNEIPKLISRIVKINISKDNNRGHDTDISRVSSDSNSGSDEFREFKKKMKRLPAFYKGQQTMQRAFKRPKRRGNNKISRA